MKKLLLVMLGVVVLSGCNANSSATSEKTPDQIKADLLKTIPGLTKIDSIAKSPVNGIDEVVIFLYALALLALERNKLDFL